MKNNYRSTAGYIGAFSLVFFLFWYSLLLYSHEIKKITPLMMAFVFIVTLALMAIHEIRQKNKYNKENDIKEVTIEKRDKIFVSVFYRYISLLIPFLILYAVINYIPFKDNFTKYIHIQYVQILYTYVLYYMAFILPIYIYLTLKYKGSYKYDFNDYSILVMISVRSIVKRTNLHKNRRVKKVLLVYILNSFFVTLLLSFFAKNFNGFYYNFNSVMHLNLDETFLQVWRRIYKFLVSIIFFIDVGIGLIGYMSASRWLGNRVRSVEFTLFGWIVALICYPPFNGYWSNYLTNYRIYDTHQIVTSDIINSLILFTMLILYIIYVLATIELGFKFSNLANKGIVTTGVYKYSRHPAYISKNLAWIIDKTFVWSNIYALIAFASWNFIYYLRAKTEENHLLKDKEYQEYKKQVPFLPSFELKTKRVKNV